METPSDFLKSALYDRVSRNRSYSLRALARDLGVSHTYLSLVMSNKKRISAQQASWMADVLGLPSERKSRFVASTLSHSKTRTPKKPIQTFHNLEVDQMQVISGWHHWAILDLTLTSDFQPDVRWIAKRLGISSKKAAEAVERLERLNLLEIKKGTWRKKESFLSIPTKRSTHCMRQLHRELMLKAMRSLACQSQSSYERRAITGAMIPTNPERLEEAKKRIAKFKRSLMRFLSEGDCTEVYQLNLQLFPLTQGDKP